MTPVIRIDNDIDHFLKRKAVEMDMVFGTPNQVLRRLLGIEGSGITTDTDSSLPDHSSPRLGHQTYVTGRKLARSHGLEHLVQQAYYRRTGDWYQLPTSYPVVFFDDTGFLIVQSESVMVESPNIQVGQTIHVPEGIDSLDGYSRCGHSHHIERP